MQPTLNNATRKLSKIGEKRDYKFAKNHQNRKCVKAINHETNEITYYNSLYAAQQHIGVNCGIVKMYCRNL